MNEKAFNPDPMFRQRKPIGTQPETVAGLIRFIDALLCLAAAFLGGDASGHRRGGCCLWLILKDRSLSGGAFKGGASRPDEALAGGGPAIFHFVAAGLSGARIGIGREHKVLAVLPEGANDRLGVSCRAGQRPGK